MGEAMPPIQLGRDTIRNLLGGETLSLDELVIVISEGNTTLVHPNDETSYFDIAWEMRQENLPEIISDLSLDSPTVLLMDEDSSLCPASISFITCEDIVSFPLFNVGVVETEIRDLLNAIPQIGTDEYPDEIDSQNQIWAALALDAKRSVVGILSSYFCRGEGGFSPDWFVIDMLRIEDEIESPFLVAFTATDADGLTSISCWSDFWNALSDHNGPKHRTTWMANSHVEVIRRDNDSRKVYFKLQDDDGFESFAVHEQSFDQLISFLTTSGWSLTETANGSVTMVSGNNNYGTVNQQTSNLSLNNQSSLISPTPNIGPTQQQPGAKELNGIINGSVNVTGLGRINGIIEGDLNVPSGADIDVRGIVEGRIIINGGTVRLFGTAGGATISSGRFELYGILENSLLHSGGDVYYDPNSIIG